MAVPTSRHVVTIIMRSSLLTAKSGDTISPHLVGINGAHFILLHLLPCVAERSSCWFTVPRFEAIVLQGAATLSHWLKESEYTDKYPA